MQTDMPLLSEGDSHPIETPSTGEPTLGVLVQAHDAISAAIHEMDVSTEAETEPAGEREAGQAENEEGQEEAESKSRPTKKYTPIKLNRAQRRLRAKQERTKQRKEARKQAKLHPVPVEVRSAYCRYCQKPFVGSTKLRCACKAEPTLAYQRRIAEQLQEALQEVQAA